MKQSFNNYTAADREVWKILFGRQKLNLETKGSKAYTESLLRMSPVLNAEHLPNFDLIGKWFKEHTGWSIAVVPGLIPVDEFFEHLAHKRFCSSTWLRNIKNLDYLEEPDMFHDIFGHIPLLSDPVFSSFMQQFGKLGVQHANKKEVVIQLQRLYWFTIEFGVIHEEKIRSYGAGIMSSFGETNHVEAGHVEFLPFSLEEIIETDFRTDSVQQKYFILQSFDQLFGSIMEFDRRLTLRSY